MTTPLSRGVRLQVSWRGCVCQYTLQYAHLPLYRGSTAESLMEGCVTYTHVNTPLHPSQEGNRTGRRFFFALIVLQFYQQFVQLL